MATRARVVYKAEALVEGPNTRFVVTTRTAPPLAVYDWYVDRGEPELWIKDLKRACFADRLSCHRFAANQFRLLLHAAAYWLLDTLRAGCASWAWPASNSIPCACACSRSADACRNGSPASACTSPAVILASPSGGSSPLGRAGRE